MTERIGANPAAPEWFPEGDGLPEGDVSSPMGGRPLAWYGERAAIDVTCLALRCDLALGAAKLVMPDGGLAEKMLDHFRSGATDPVEVDLDRELERNPHLKEVLVSRIETDLAESSVLPDGAIDESGAIWIRQSDYGTGKAADDQRLGLGGTFVEYAVVGSDATGGLEVALNVSDHYFWTPSDDSRTSQCLHECASAMVAAGKATEFHQFGEGSVVVADPRAEDPIPAPAETQRENY
jgi:hypothetical protein